MIQLEQSSPYKFSLSDGYVLNAAQYHSAVCLNHFAHLAIIKLHATNICSIAKLKVLLTVKLADDQILALPNLIDVLYYYKSKENFQVGIIMIKRKETRVVTYTCRYSSHL